MKKNYKYINYFYKFCIDCGREKDDIEKYKFRNCEKCMERVQANILCDICERCKKPKKLNILGLCSECKKEVETLNHDFNKINEKERYKYTF